MNQPAYAPPPPQPSGGGGALKWILIGCGILGGIAVLCMGSCFALGYMGFQQAKKWAEAWEQFATKTEQDLRTNQHIVAKVGKVQTLTQIGSPPSPAGQQQEMRAELRWKVKGEKGEGIAAIDFRITSSLKPEILSRNFYHGGKKIDLDTGAETDEPSPEMTPDDPPPPEKEEDN